LWACGGFLAWFRALMVSIKPLVKLISSAEVGRPVPVSPRVGL